MTTNLLADNILNTIGSVLLAILILLVMITVHEFGHYLAGKALKFKIEEFSIGFGPAFFKRRNKRNGELFSLRAFPLGGYCAFESENEEGASPESFNNKAPWKRIIVLAAGPLMNYLLALLVIIISLFTFGLQAYKVNTVQESQTYAVEYSLADGDVLLAAEGRNIYLITDAMSALSGKKEGDEARLTVLREGKEQELTIILRADCDFKNSSQVYKFWNAVGAGVVTGDDGNDYYDLTGVNVKYDFWGTLGRSFGYSYALSGSILKVLGELLTGNLNITAVGGPVTTIKLTSQIASQGVQSFLEIAAYIGVNLAVFNLLPIPALDGSKIVFCVIEWICRKPVPRKVEAIIHAVGFVLILGFAILVDILQFASCG
jgi:regulator of sigma E protease